ncbi:MAG TPA: MMPL family transporter [Burkholderiales bacterium]|nr:MMPL family transporter [Burkholderiales bacterium]
MNAIRLRALLWFLLALLIAWATVRSLQSGNALQTNLLALLPPTERNPVAETAIAHLADAAGNRAIFLIGHPQAEEAKEAANAFAKALRTSGTFNSVQAKLPPFDPVKLSELYLRHRFHLLSEADREALSSGAPNLEARLQQKLHAPFRFGIGLPVTDYPFGFTENWLNALPLNSFKLELDEGYLRTPPAAGRSTYIFVSAELSGSVYDGQVQKRAMLEIENAEQAARNKVTDVELLRTGPLFYAEAARKRAEFEVDLIGAGSLIGMLALLYWLFRSPKPLLLGMLSVGFGIGAAYTITIALNGHIHLITLVFGASLIGEAIDYSIQYFAAHLGASAQWDPLRGLKSVLPGLTVALATSLLGYGALSLAPFPALKQIALFALVGLVAAYLSVLLLLPAMMRQPSKRDPVRATELPRRLLQAWTSHMNKARCTALIALSALVAVPGWAMLKTDDDVRVLINRPAALVADESRIRDLTGFDTGTQFFLIEGATTEDVLQREELLRKRLAPLIAEEKLSKYQSVSAFVPSMALQEQNRALWRKALFEDERAVKRLLHETGLRPELVDQWRAKFEAEKPLLVENWLSAPLSTPYRQLWLGQGEHGYASILLPQGVRDLQVLAAAAEGLEGVSWIDKAGSISKLFARYRGWGALWLGGTLTLVYVLLTLRYGTKRAMVVLIPAAIGIALAAAFFGYAGIPLNLFNLMALMLVLGVGVNYAIFLIEGGEREPGTWSGVLLSAGTTLLSFGLLAFSAMPALAGFGLTLLIGIGVAVLLSPMVLTLSARKEVRA